MHGVEFPEVPVDGEVGEDGRLVDVPKAQKLLGDITYREVFKMLGRKEIVGIKLGRRRMIVKASIDQLIDRKIAEVSVRAEVAA